MEIRWDLETGKGKHISNPTWQQIKHALQEMDGPNVNEVILKLAEKGSMFVEGGDEGRYLVVYFPANHPDTPSLTLSDLSLTGPDVPLTVQTPSAYTAKHAVTFPLVLKVVEYFFQKGEIPKDVRWKLDNTEIEADL